LREPTYLSLWKKGGLTPKVKQARGHLISCRLCPRSCRANRLKGEKGFCDQGVPAKVANALPHFGEEPPLSGEKGAGTVFFSGCALRCLYCQNYQISQEGLGDEIGPEELARLFLSLQGRGCHNLDLVSPTPHLPAILEALDLAIPQGFRLPLVYNTHGYLGQETLALLEGVVDIYLPDAKYGLREAGSDLSQAEDYVSINQTALRLMFHQVGPLKVDSQGLAYRGLLVRHLLLPGYPLNSRRVLETLAALSLEIPISLMAQYRPFSKACQVPGLNRPLTAFEYQQTLQLAEALGFEEIFIQDLQSADQYYPDFTRKDPF
jgi:putative pyruvate formate lyase activating enzyme